MAKNKYSGHWENMNLYLMGKENKMLITFDKKAYIVDISDLGNMK